MIRTWHLKAALFITLGFTAACRVTPIVVGGQFTWPQEHTVAEKSEVEVSVLTLLERFLAMIEKKDFLALPELVSRERGLWVDLKSHWSYEELVKEVSREDGYLQSFYLNTGLLRSQSGDPERLALRDVLKESRRIEASIYMEAGGQECEVKLNLIDSPELNYHLNNPVFIKEKNRWKIYRLF